MTIFFRSKKTQTLTDVQSVETRPGYFLVTLKTVETIPGHFIITLKDGTIMTIEWDKLIKIEN